MTRLPDFIIGGAPKSGTTTLNYNLGQHPDIYMSPIKEPRYFAYDADNPQHQTRSGFHFPIRTLDEYAKLFDDVTTESAVGESTPIYLFSDIAPYRIHDTIPQVKMIFSLRDPVQRAYSAYWHRVRAGNEDRPIEEALVENEHYVTNGRYYEKLVTWYDLFSPDQIKLILLSDISRNAEATFQELFRFVGVDDSFVPDMTVRNKGGSYKNRRMGLLLEKVKTHPVRKSLLPRLPKPLRDRMVDLRSSNFEAPPPMPDDLERRLRAYYDDDIVKLEVLMQRDLTSWRVKEALPATT